MDDLVIINAPLVDEILNKDRKKIIQLIEEAYLDYHKGYYVNPDSFFLRFPDHDRNRIIGLAASNIQGENKISGIKWIASYPDNLKHHLPRANASIILNDYDTGRVKAFIEGSAISASRTAASAALAAKLLIRDQTYQQALCFVGCGIIAKTILEFMRANNILIDCVYLYDLNPSTAETFQQELVNNGWSNIHIAATLKEGFAKADIVTFATTAMSPYVSKDVCSSELLRHKILLGISLRDICTDIILESNNIVDDIEHCLKANTSVHLTEQQVNHRQFINGTIHDLITHSITLDQDKATIFSPFGMGMLDLKVAQYIYQEVMEAHSGLRCSFH